MESIGFLSCKKHTTPVQPRCTSAAEQHDLCGEAAPQTGARRSITASRKQKHQALMLSGSLWNESSILSRTSPAHTRALPCPGPCFLLWPPGQPHAAARQRGQAVLPALPGQHRRHTCDATWRASTSCEKRKERRGEHGGAPRQRMQHPDGPQEQDKSQSHCPTAPVTLLAPRPHVLKDCNTCGYHNPLLSKTELQQQQWYFKQ